MGLKAGEVAMVDPPRLAAEEEVKENCGVAVVYP